MVVSVCRERRLAEVWLTRSEGSDPDVWRKLEPMYAQFHQRRFQVAVFASGEGDLYQNTRELLRRSRKHPDFSACPAGTDGLQ